MDPQGEQLTNAGRICGLIGTILNVVCIGGYLIAIAFFGVAAFQAGPGK
jgi:hypothetical protein